MYLRGKHGTDGISSGSLLPDLRRGTSTTHIKSCLLQQESIRNREFSVQMLRLQLFNSVLKTHLQL